MVARIELQRLFGLKLSQDAGPEVGNELLAVEVAPDEDELVEALLAGLPRLAQAIRAGPKAQQHVHALEEVPACMPACPTPPQLTIDQISQDDNLTSQTQILLDGPTRMVIHQQL
jgi:hypothetical protein